MIWATSLSLQAGPKGYFRTEKGALIKGEVLYADDTFYYYQKVSSPEEIRTVKIENVPASFQRTVNALRLKGEIGTPPESIAVVQIEVVEKPYGEWLLEENVEHDGLSWHTATLAAVDDFGQTIYLKIRYCEGIDYDYRKFDVLLIFSHTVSFMHRWQVTYQFDNNEPVTELWRGSISHRALFSTTSFAFREKLIESDHLNFVVTDSQGKTRRFRFVVNNFDRVYEDLFKPMIHE